MDALFVVPALVSPNVNQKMIPALAKMIERNIVLNNAATFKKAVLLKYNSASKISKMSLLGRIGLRNEGVEDKNSNLNNLNESKGFNPENLHGFNMKLNNFKEKFKDLDPQADDFIQNYTILYNDYIDVAAQSGNVYDVNGRMNSNDIFSKDTRNDFINGFKNMMSIYSNRKDGIDKLEMERLNKQMAAAEKDADRKFNIAQNQANRELNLQLTRMKMSTDVPVELKTKEMKKKIQDIKYGVKKKKLEIKQLKKEISSLNKYISNTSKTAFGDVETETKLRPITMSLDDVEVPRGITFFKQISAEPTILEIPIMMNLDTFGEKQVNAIIKVGVKCIPYTVDDMTSVKHLLKYTRLMGLIEKKFRMGVRSLKRSPFWVDTDRGFEGVIRPEKREIFKGNLMDPLKAKNMIIYSPTQKELINPRFLANRMSSAEGKNWSTVVILAANDFDDMEMSDLIRNYKKLKSSYFGDMIITNEARESIYFCAAKYNQCQDIPLDYLKKVLDLNNVLDYSTIARHSSAWRMEARPGSGILNNIVKALGIKRESSNECPVCEKNKLILEMKKMEERRNKIRFVLDSYLFATDEK